MKYKEIQSAAIYLIGLIHMVSFVLLITKGSGERERKRKKAIYLIVLYGYFDYNKRVE